MDRKYASTAHPTLMQPHPQSANHQRSAPCQHQLLATHQLIVCSQFSLLAGEHHFDISYYAFEQLAHPTYGAMMLEYRSTRSGDGQEGTSRASPLAITPSGSLLMYLASPDSQAHAH